MAKFWADPLTEPKRAYRWLLYLNAGQKIPSWVITKVSQPSFEISEKEHQFLNHKFYYPGRITWNEVKFTLVDPVVPDSTGDLQSMIHHSGYIFPNESNLNQMTDTISKDRATRQTLDVKIELLGPSGVEPPTGDSSSAGVVAGSWKLTNSWIKSITYSELSYESDDLVNAEVTLRYDWAEYTRGNPAAARV